MTITQTITMPEIAVVFPTNFSVAQYSGREVRLSLADVLLDGDDPMVLSDSEIIERVANTLSTQQEVTSSMFEGMIVTRPQSGNILIAEKPVFGPCGGFEMNYSNDELDSYEDDQDFYLTENYDNTKPLGVITLSHEALEILKNGRHCIVPILQVDSRTPIYDFTVVKISDVVSIDLKRNDLPFTDELESDQRKSNAQKS